MRSAAIAWAVSMSAALTVMIPSAVPSAAQEAKPTVSSPTLVPEMNARVAAAIPEIERYIAAGMQAFDCPGLAIGIIVGDKLVYSKGFGVRQKGGQAVDTQTVFQIGSATKAFLAATLGIMVDRGKLKWDDRVVDRMPTFQLHDPWVTREVRVFDLLAQRSGLPPYVNDAWGILGYDKETLVRSLRFVEPVSSFRSTFAYTNITHVVAGDLVAGAAGAKEWSEVVQSEIASPLGMSSVSVTAAGIEAAPNHASGHVWSPQGTRTAPFTELFPYVFRGAGAINANVPDMAKWVALQIANGKVGDRQLISPESMAMARTAKVGLTGNVAYGLGWILQQTPNGSVVWHNGGTTIFGAMVGFLPDKGVGVVVLSNETNVGLPDALGLWVLDRVLGNPMVDHAAMALTRAKANAEKSEKLFSKPAGAAPAPLRGPLAGRFISEAFGPAEVKEQGDGLVMTVQSGAEFTISPWNGDVFTFTLLPKGRLAAVAEGQGSQPFGFAQFQMGPSGKPDVLMLTFDDGQAYRFTRDDA